MSRGLQVELKQKIPFTSREAEAYLSLLRTADALQTQVEAKLKLFGLTGTQYNALRILRGAGPEGLPCREIGERMITRDPDITRLLDRLEARGLVARSRQKKDRRVVQARITPAGTQLLKKLDRPMDAMHRKQFAHVPAAHLKQLLEHLKEIRSAVAQIKACAGDEEESH